MSTFPRAWAIGVINKMQDYFEARFENTFKKRIGESDQQYIDRLVNTTCEILEGVTAEQIKVGLATMKTAKYCPVMPEFKNWCLGGNDNAIHASYRKKSAALANIEAWLCDDTTQITNAEREAYNRCYGMFNDLQFNYSAKQKFHTYEAFKDFYDEAVKEFVEKGVEQSVFYDSLQIEQKKEKRILTTVNKDLLNWSEHVHGYIVGRTGFRHEKIEINVSDIRDYAKKNKIGFAEAEAEMRTSRINKIVWTKEND